MTPEKKVYFLSYDDTLKALNWRDSIDCLHNAYRLLDTPTAVPPRVVARRNGIWLRALAAISPSGRYMGAKIFGKARQPLISYLIALWDQETADLVGLIDAQHVTAVRTAATSAVAANCLLSQEEVHIAVLGSGLEATTHVRAIETLRKVKSLKVFSPTLKSRKSFAEKFTEEMGVECRPVDSARAALAHANLIIAAARSYDETPILEGSWLEAGMTVVSIGSTLPEQREVDPEVIRRAHRVIADVPEEVMNDSGDFLAAHAAGVDFREKVFPLADLVQGKCPGRQNGHEILLYKSVGSALQDIAVSELCFGKARQLGLGTPLPMGLSMKNLKPAALLNS